MIVLKLNIFQMKLENTLEIKILKRIFIVYNHMIQKCTDTFELDLFDFMLKGKSLLEYTNLFSANDYEKNDIKIPKYFQ